MISFGVFYLIGALLGEIVLLALWFKSQPSGVTVRDYLKANLGDVLLSGALAGITCVAWAEGTIAKLVIDKWSLDLPDTLGVSIVAGAVVSIFAHQIIDIVSALFAFFAKRAAGGQP